MLEEIIDVMTDEGIIKWYARDDVRRRFSTQVSYDQLREKDIDITGNERDNHLLF